MHQIRTRLCSSQDSMTVGLSLNIPNEYLFWISKELYLHLASSIYKPQIQIEFRPLILLK